MKLRLTVQRAGMLAAVVGATMLLDACGAGGGTGGGFTYVTTSSTEDTTSATGGSGGYGIGFKTCDPVPEVTAPCDKSSSAWCTYASECDPKGCAARCIAGAWKEICQPCSPAVACPAAPPAHGSPCTGAENDGKPCHYDACAIDNELATATCSGGAWQVDYAICDPVTCSGSGKTCPGGQACADTPACEVWPQAGCLDDPCKHEPLSCACAASLCPAGTVCAGTQAGRVVCDAPPGPMVVTGLSHVEELGVDASSIYFTGDIANKSWFALFRAPLAGGAPTLVTNTSSLSGLVVTPSAAYLSDWNLGVVSRLPLPSGQSAVLASGEDDPQQPAANSTHLFWMAGPNWGRTIRRLSLSGGAPSTLLAAGSGPSRFVVDDQSVYWVGSQGDVLSKQPLDGSPGGPMVSGMSITGLDQDATYVYLTDSMAGLLGRVPKAGGALEVLASGLAYPTQLAVGATHVYWIDGVGFTIHRKPLAGGAIEVMAQHQPAGALRLDATHVYWTVQASKCAGVARMLK